MARVAGRSVPVTVLFTLLCVAILIGLVLLAAPMVPPVGMWLQEMANGLTELIRALALS